MYLRVRRCWAKATQAMDAWQTRDQAWQMVKAALQLVTPEGELNTRARAETALAAALPQLPDDFAKAKRLLQQPQTLTYLDEVHRQVQALPVPAEIRDAAIRQETLRHRPELLQGDTVQAAAVRGSGHGLCGNHRPSGGGGPTSGRRNPQNLPQHLAGEQSGGMLNSTVRMQQARHRKMTQGLVDLSCLHWNTRTFRTGRRRGRSPYGRLDVPWPDELGWWDILKWTPEQLRVELSAREKPK